MRRLVALSPALAALACTRGPSPDQHKADATALIDQWVSAINTGRGAAAVQMLAPDYVWHLPGGNVVGRDSAQKIFAALFAKCPQLKTTAEQVLGDGEYVVVRWTDSCSPNTPPTSDITIDRFGHGQFLEGWGIASDKPWVR